MNTACHIHIIDDDASVRSACGFLMDALGHQHHTWEHGAAFLQHAPLHQAAVALLDLRMPLLDGEKALQALQTQHSAIATIVLTGHGDVATAVRLLKQGAADFLLKPIQAEPLQHAIANAWQQALKLQQLHQWRQNELSLSPKEQRIMALLVQGMTNKDMAAHLCVSQRTIEVQRASLMHKLGCEHVAQLVHIYWQLHPQAQFN